MSNLTRVLLVVLAVIFFAPDAGAQGYNWPTLLGPPDPSSPAVRTPKYGVLVDTQGYDLPHPKWVEKKAPNKLRKLDVPEELIAAEQQYARSLSGADGGPVALLKDIDDAIDRLGVCPGSYGAYARGFPWSTVTVHIRATPWAAPEINNQIVNGLTTDKRTAHFIAVGFNFLFSNPDHAEMVGAFNLAEWELGNLLFWNWAGSSKDVGNSCQ